MTDNLVTFQQFGGIVKSLANRSPNTFRSLINLRSDIRPGDLVPRYGYITNQDSDGAYSYGISPDGFFFNDFGDIQSRIYLYNAGIWADPGIQQDPTHTTDIQVPRQNLTDCYLQLTIVSVSGGGTQILVPGDSTFADKVKYWIVRNATRSYVYKPGGVGSVRYTNEFATVTASSLSSGGNVTLTLSWATDWLAGDVVTLFRNDLQGGLNDLQYALGATLPYTVLTTPQFVNVGGKNQVGIFGVSDNVYNRPLWVGRIINQGYFNNAFMFNGLYATSLMDDFSYGPFSPTYPHISITTNNISQSGAGSFNNLFQFSFTLLLDGFNETAICGGDSDPYNVPPSILSTETVTNITDFPEINPLPAPARIVIHTIVGDITPPINSNLSPTTKITLKISVPKADIINRRVTGINLYSRQIRVTSLRVGGGYTVQYRYAWRQVMYIDVNDSTWTFDATHQLWYINKTIVADMLSGPLYTDLTGCAPNDVMTKQVAYATSLNDRIVVRDNVNTQTLFFSPINSNGNSESALPSSSYFLITKKQGSIIGLSSINDQLIVWKEFSTWVVNVQGLPDLVKDNYVSLDVGLASLKSIVRGNRVVAWVSYSGIYATDGFKIYQINKDWIEEFLTYSQSSLQSSVGFYDAKTSSYYIYINNILWVYNFDTNKWHQEDLTHSLAGITFGVPRLISTDLTGRTVFAGANDSGLYQFPRADFFYRDSIYYAPLMFPFSPTASFQTNDTEIAAEDLVYLNNAFARGESLPSILINFLAGSTNVGSSSISNDVQVFPVRSKTAVSRFSLQASMTYDEYFALRQLGVYTKVMKRAGSIKVGA